MNLFDRIRNELREGRGVAVATIARRLGSAPRSAGTRCAVLADGTLVGTIGGGALEARVREEASPVLAEGRVRVVPFRMDARQLADEGMVCGGSVDVVITPWSPRHEPVAGAAARGLGGRAEVLLVTAWGPGGSGPRVAARWAGEWTGDELDPAARVEEPVFRHGPEGGLLAEAVEPERVPLVILGAGHVGRAVAQVAAVADFEVTVVDDRPEFASAEAIPWADRVVCRSFRGVFGAVEVGPDAFVVVCTRGHLSDAEAAAEALRTPARYVGVIGSRRKRQATLERLRAAGIPEERLGVLRMPVGLDIEAETPGEIAVAVVAQMIAERRRGEVRGPGQRAAGGR